MPKPYNPHDKLMIKAKEEGFRARSVYKLKELDEHYHLIQQGMTVLDIGAAPGSWLQYVSQKIGGDGIALGLDIQTIKPIASNVVTRVCDVNNLELVTNYLNELGLDKVDLVVSDIAPNTTGIKYLDQKRSIDLNKMVVKIAQQYLKPGGKLIMKIFQGENFQDFYRELKHKFHSVKMEKVSASRDRSKEIYLICS